MYLLTMLGCELLCDQTLVSCQTVLCFYLRKFLSFPQCLALGSACVCDLESPGNSGIQEGREGPESSLSA